MKAGYARGVYSSTQLQRMLRGFEAASCAEVVIDVRPQSGRLFRNLQEKLHPGDTLAVWNYECTAGGSTELTNLIVSLQVRGIGFESLAEGLAVPTGRTLSPATIAALIERASMKLLPLRRRVQPTVVGGGAHPEAAVLVAGPAR
jgi:hypothetical protein